MNNQYIMAKVPKISAAALAIRQDPTGSIKFNTKVKRT